MIKKTSKRDRIIKHLIEKLGCQELESPPYKYRKFTSPSGKSFIWVGKSGAVRVGRIVSKSISVTHKFVRI